MKFNTNTVSSQLASQSELEGYPGHTECIMKGNFAAAEAAKLCRVGFVPAYPITPQTTIIERISTLVMNGAMDATYINMDSEHSVFAAAMGAAIGGERVFTATAGQGLFYSHEVLHAIAHFRLPIVMCNVGRPSIPWNIWSDQSDSLAQRDTGWVQFYGESSQEVLDTIIQAYVLAERLQVPVMVVLDAFYQSHTSENIWIPDQPLVDRFLPEKSQGAMCLDFAIPKAFGGLVPPEHYNKLNYSYWKDILRVEDESENIARAFADHFGREYHNIETVNIGPETKLVLVCLSSITSTVRGVLCRHPDVGLLKIRLFKPFPKASVRKALVGLPEYVNLVAIERNFLGDHDGAIKQELERALYGESRKILDFYAGLGGKDVSPTTIETIIQKAKTDPQAVNWIDVD
jgi:pyruvate/2-oxoacid:ferredoxin oxidoreductase alpha subunit